MKFIKEKKEPDYSLFTAAEKYKHIIDDFPEVVDVMNYEVHHGDAVLGLLKTNE